MHSQVGPLNKTYNLSFKILCNSLSYLTKHDTNQYCGTVNTPVLSSSNTCLTTFPFSISLTRFLAFSSSSCWFIIASSAAVILESSTRLDIV